MQLSRNRIEALTDGVFAVSMTLLVLDIKVPELQEPLATAELPVKLLALWPKFLSYTSSFVILGVYWVGHHVQLSFIRRADLWSQPDLNRPDAGAPLAVRHLSRCP
jgi:uncharacterized membrane protein